MAVLSSILTIAGYATVVLVIALVSRMLMTAILFIVLLPFMRGRERDERRSGWASLSAYAVSAIYSAVLLGGAANESQLSGWLSLPITLLILGSWNSFALCAISELHEPNDISFDGRPKLKSVKYTPASYLLVSPFIYFAAIAAFYWPELPLLLPGSKYVIVAADWIQGSWFRYPIYLYGMWPTLNGLLLIPFLIVAFISIPIIFRKKSTGSMHAGSEHGAIT